MIGRRTGVLAGAPDPDRTLVTSPSPASRVPAATAPTVREPRKARAALGRYRVMAWVTGVMLLVLTVEIVLKYVVGAPESVLRWIEWVPFAHGWIYVIYLVTVLDLWSKMRWGFGRLVGMVLAGVVPVMSFVVERRVHADAEARLG
jgi:integral membrane protein